jgi:SSS family solute:Na+ symporter
MCSEYFRSWGIEAIFFLTAMFAVLGIYLNSNAKDKVQDVKALSIDLTLFNTDKTFRIGSALVIIILIILYIALW